MPGEQGYIPAPDVRPTIASAMFFHPRGNAQVLGPMVATHATGHSVSPDSLQKQVEDGLSAIIRVNANAGDVAGISINEAVDDELPADETCTGEDETCDAYAGRTEYKPCWPS